VVSATVTGLNVCGFMALDGRQSQCRSNALDGQCSTNSAACGQEDFDRFVKIWDLSVAMAVGLTSNFKNMLSVFSGGWQKRQVIAINPSQRQTAAGFVL
jgi:hypothetical protein